MKSLSVVVLFTSGLVASPVTISLRGTYGQATQNNIYLAPNGTFSLSFEVGNPATVAVSGGAAVPEPATWVLMLAGLLIAGADRKIGLTI